MTVVNLRHHDVAEEGQTDHNLGETSCKEGVSEEKRTWGRKADEMERRVPGGDKREERKPAGRGPEEIGQYGSNREPIYTPWRAPGSASGRLTGFNATVAAHGPLGQLNHTSCTCMYAPSMLSVSETHREDIRSLIKSKITFRRLFSSGRQHRAVSCVRRPGFTYNLEAAVHRSRATVLYSGRPRRTR